MDNKITSTFILLFCVAQLVGSRAIAADIQTIYVAPKGTTAYDNAKQLADESDSAQSARKVQKALNMAATIISSADCGDCEVRIKIAEGEFVGKAKTGHWQFPDVKAPNATLRILGGYDESFSTRDPFTYPTQLVTNPNRSQPVLTFQGKKHALRELMVSGLTVDLSNSNSYDSGTNTLMKGSSSSYGMFAFGYLTAMRLVISDNILMNAPNGVASPRLRAMSDDAEVVVFNNLIVNNVHPWVIATGGYKHTLARYIVASNSFVMNWPYNPDKHTSNPGALEIGDRHIAKNVEITKNLFAYNAGGAIHTQYDDDAGPTINIHDNLFWRNGTLFEVDDVESGAVVGKFAGSGTYTALSMEDVEDDFTWTVSNNVSFDPELSLSPPKMKSVAYASLNRKGSSTNEVEASEEGKEEFIEESTDELTDFGDSELDALSAELENLLSEEPIADVPEELELNLEKEDFGEDFDTAMGFDDTEADVSNFAPYFKFDPERLPISYVAPNIGVDSANVAQY